MSYRDLITFDRLKQANTGKTVSSLTDIHEEAEATIRGVSSLLRSRLGRVLIVEAVTQRAARHHWREDETTTGTGVWTYADEQPVVQMDTSETRQTERRITADRRFAGEVRYYAGFRRPDQVLTSNDGQTEALPAKGPSDFDDLDTLPPTLPSMIEEVAVNITLHVLDKRGDELGRRTTRSIGAQEVVTESADSGFISRQLGRLSRFDRSGVHSSPVETTPLSDG